MSELCNTVNALHVTSTMSRLCYGWKLRLIAFSPEAWL